MSLRARLTLWNVLVLAILLILMGAALRARVQARLEAGINRELAKRGQFFPRNRAVFPPRSFSGRRGSGFPIFTASGVPIQGRQIAPDPYILPTVLKRKQPTFTTRGLLRIYSLPLETNEGPGVYQTSESLAPVEQEVNKLTGELLTLLPFGLLAAALGGLFLTERALRPIETLRKAAASIQASDLSQRLEVQGRDELARLSVTFNEMLARLETAFERQRQFVADASHELRTPLTTILAASELGLADVTASEKNLRLFGRIEEATQRTVRLVQNLLILARSDSGALVVNSAELPVERLFESVAAEAYLLHPTGARLLLQTNGEVLYGDGPLLFQLLFNLTDNALRHTPPEGSVTLAATPEGIVVTDTGTGISPEHLPYLTERFYRVDSARARKNGGTGLGLAICKSIAEAHGGTLVFESTLGVGTRVLLALPHATGVSEPGSRERLVKSPE